jgi:hypothetical protein
MKKDKTLDQLEQLVERHAELRKDMLKAEKEIKAHLDKHLEGANGKKLARVIDLALKLKYGHA